MRKAVLTVLVLVATFVAGGVAAVVVLPQSAFRDSASSPPSASTTASDPVTTAPTSTPPTSTPPVTPSTPPSSTSTTTSSPATDCTPSTPLVDPQATPQAKCLVAGLEQWQSNNQYGAGQELNLSSKDYNGPLEKLHGQGPSVIGFDLGELEQGQGYGFADSPLDGLLQLNQAGAVLVACYHMPDPQDGGSSYDRNFTNLGQLVADRGKVARRFWSDFDDKMTLLKTLQTGDNGRYPPAAVIFRPMHEANGNWFWWGQPDPGTYKQLYADMQERAADDGVHNIVWGWSFNAQSGSNVEDPSSLVPDHVDLIGIDTYENMTNRSTPDQQMNLSGLSGMVGKAPLLAVTEAGPQGSKDGNWDPESVDRAAVAQGLHPVFEMMWFDDGTPSASDPDAGKKQISSLQQGPAWLASCPHGVCTLQ